MPPYIETPTQRVAKPAKSRITLRRGTNALRLGSRIGTDELWLNTDDGRLFAGDGSTVGGVLVKDGDPDGGGGASLPAWFDALGGGYTYDDAPESPTYGQMVTTNPGPFSLNIDAYGTHDQSVSLGVGSFGYGAGTAVGAYAKGHGDGAAVGYRTWAYNGGAAVGSISQGQNSGAAVGSGSAGYSFGAAVGYGSLGHDNGAAVGNGSQGQDCGAAVGYLSQGQNYGAAVGHSSQGQYSGAAVGNGSLGQDGGAAVGYGSAGYNYGAAVGSNSWGHNNGAAVGYETDGQAYCLALGNKAKAFGYGDGGPTGLGAIINRTEIAPLDWNGQITHRIQGQPNGTIAMTFPILANRPASAPAAFLNPNGTLPVGMMMWVVSPGGSEAFGYFNVGGVVKSTGLLSLS